MRECKEEAGIDFRGVQLHRPPVFHPESSSQSVIFWVETAMQPAHDAHPDIVEYRQFKAWPDALNPRLKYDKGFALKKEMEQLGFA